MRNLHSNLEQLTPDSMNKETRLTYIEEKLKSLLMSVLFIVEDEIDVNENFVDLGVDSISGVEFAKMASQQLGVDISVTDIYEYSTVGLLARHLQGCALEQHESDKALSQEEKKIDALDLNSSSSVSLSKASNLISAASVEVVMLELRTQLADLLYMPVDELDSNDRFSDLGIDSIICVEWVKKINRVYDFSMPVIDLYEQTTLVNLANYIVSLTGVSVQDHKENQPSDQPVDIGPLTKQLQQQLADILYMDIDDIDIHEKFVDFGIDSISGVEWVKNINREFGLNIDVTIIYDHSTTASLSGYIADRLSKKGLQQASILSLDGSVDIQTSLQIPSSVEIETNSSKEKPVSAAEPIKLKGHRYTSTLIEPPKDSQSMSEESPLDAEQSAVAVIGVSGRFPKADNIETFWRNLEQGLDAVEEVNQDRWEIMDYYSENPRATGKTYSKWCGALNEIDKFDASFFTISPREAELMDPQQRIFLEEAWRVFEDAGYSPKSLSGRSCGVFVGVGQGDYYTKLRSADVVPDAYTLMGMNSAILASRLAYYLDLKGASMAIDTACSSSLVAVHEACQSILSGQVEMALAGGVYILTTPEMHIMASKSNMLSPEGKCKSFDNGANGFVIGEGVGVILLKRLCDAERDGDHIYGVIRGTGINQDGATNGITAPSKESQKQLELDVYKKFAINPKDIELIEAHGTGTKLGDPIEIAALTNAFREYTDKKQYCAVGSVKSQIGHGLTAAGISGLIKILLALKNKRIPGSLHFEQANEHIDFKNSPFYVNTASRDWPRNGDKPRQAAVSSFGFSGTNAHIVVEEYTVPEPNHTRYINSISALCILSAKTVECLRESAVNIRRFIGQRKNMSHIEFLDVMYTLQTGREAMLERFAVFATDPDDLVKKLDLYIKEETAIDDCYRGRLDKEAEARTKAPNCHAGLWNNDEALQALAQAWVSGCDIDWQCLYAGMQPRKVGLPTYPFARERYWVPESLSKANSKFNDVSKNSVNFPDQIEPGAGLHVYQELWQRTAHVDISKQTKDASTVDTIIYLGADNCEIDNFENYTVAQGWNHKPIFVETSSGFEKLSDRHYRLDTTQEECYRSLFECVLGEHKDSRSIVIIYRDTKAAEFTAIQSIHALLRATKNHSVALTKLCLIEKSQPNFNSLYTSSYIAFRQSLTLLMPNLKLAVVYHDNEHLDVETVLTEARQGGIVRYQQGQRYTPTLVPTQQSTQDSPVLIKQGVYVIVGGCGSLGFLFSEYLAKHYQAHLVLIGRRKLHDGIEHQLRTLKSVGATAVEYICADVSQVGEMESVIQTIEQRFEPVNGVIHAAGTFSEKPVFEKEWEDFCNALQTKVQGSIVLDEVTAHLDLDFICYFSSSSAVLGDFGACDYAIGNRFQMAYGDHRNTLRKAGKRRGKTCVVNWPLWRDGGMGHTDFEQTKMYLSSSGQRYLEADEGVSIWEKLLRSDIVQHLVLAGEPLRIGRFLNRVYGPEQLSSALSEQAEPIQDISTIQTEHLTEQPDQHDSHLAKPDFLYLSGRVKSDVAAQIYRVLKLRNTEIEDNINFADFGFDSISLTEFAHGLSEFYALEIVPSILFSYSTIVRFSDYIINEYPQRLSEFYHLEPQPHDSAVVKTASATNGVKEQQPRPAMLTGAGGSRTSATKPYSVTTNKQANQEPIAIIGMSGKFAGADNIDELWDVLSLGKKVTAEIPQDRWDWQQYFSEPGSKDNVISTNKGGFIRGVQEFDPLFFEISPREAEMMDPKQRVFLQEAWHAFENAGYSASQINGSHCGVFVGVEEGEYGLLTRGHENELATNRHNGVLAARVSYFLDLKGPNLAINTACSSSLVALHYACQSLKNGECELALAGGINLLLTPDIYKDLSKLGMLSPSGECFAFDERADGIVPGEAVAVLLLKPLSKAMADRDIIHGVVRGSGVNYDGKTNGITAPSGVSQKSLIESVYQKSNIAFDDVGYLLAHGTGTKLGDPVEVNALNEVFGQRSDKQSYCALGSIKPTLGHTFSASGILSVISALMSMKHKKIPAVSNYKNTNPYINFQSSPFYINDGTKNWDPSDGKSRIAAVSAFGMSGTNAHVIVEEYIEPAKIHGVNRVEKLILLSAKDEDRLKEYADSLKVYLSNRSSISDQELDAVAYTLQVGRTPMEARVAFLIHSREELLEMLTEFCEHNNIIKNVYRGTVGLDKGTLQLFTLDEELEEALTKWIERGKLNKLAGLWVKGLEVDWQLLYENDPPQRISLPTYPFAKERYWVTGTAGMSNNSIGQRRLHPLLHENVSDLDGQQFSSVFSGEEYFLRDHKVQAEKVLPGVAHLEMACKAGALSSQQEVVEIRDVVWSKPIRVNGAALEVQIGLYPTADAVAYEIVTDAPETPEQRTLHSQGKILLGARSEREQPERLDIEAIAARCPDMQEASYCYEVFKTQGLEYGDSFQGLKRIRYNSNEALAELELPSNLLSGKETYDLHPSLLDAALQSTLGLSLTQGGETGPGPHIPFSVKQIQVYSQATACVYAYVRYSAEMKRDGKVLKYDIDLMDSAGNIAIALKEFTALPVVEADSIVRQDNTPAEQGEGVKPSVAQAAIMSQSDDNRDNPTPNVEEELKRRANDYFRSVLAKLLKIDIKRVDANAALEKYGIDSIMIVSLTTELEKQFGVLSKTLFFEYQTLAELTDYFLDTHREQLLSLINAVSPSLGTKEAVASSAVHTTAEPPSSDITTTKPPTVKRRRFNQQLPSQPGKPSDAEAADEAIAIIGVSGRYPKAPNLQAFWDNLTQGRDCIEEIPADRWDHSQYYDADKDKAGKTYGKWGGFIDDVDKFDPMFFNISPREAEIMDPQERLFLETVWETLEDAGYTRESLNKTQDSKTGLAGEVGVYVGVMYEEYQLYGAEQSQQGNVMALSGNPASIANRVSYYCNFHGPSMALDTMCSSSLTAIHLACEAIKSGSCQAAIAGGVNVSIHPNKYIALGQGKFISSKGRCESFGEGGEGYVPGEGVGAVLLKPLSQARADGDQIYAVVKGTTLNHGGKTNGYTVPNPQAQSAVIEKTLATAKVDPRAISYIEAHGTGTSLGDPIEIRGLAKAFSAYTQDKQYCAIGSVKSNIGHCESAAGIAGVTKVLLQMKHKQLVPSLHSQHLNPNIDFSETPFKVQQTLQEWLPPEINEDGDVHKYPRIAGVSSFGAGGSNAHVLLEEYCSEASEDSAAQAGPVIVPLSAKNSDRLKEYAKRLLSFITKEKSVKGFSDAVPKTYRSQLCNSLQLDIMNIIGNIMNIEPSELDTEIFFGEWGMDVIHINSLIEQIFTILRIDGSYHEIENHNSIDTLVDYLLHNHFSEVSEYYKLTVSQLSESVKSGDDNSIFRLPEMAYTLQVGREKMNYRVAFVVEDIAELCDKLQAYIAGEQRIDHCYWNLVKSRDNNTEFSNVLQLREQILKWLKSGNIDEIAKRWVDGLDFDWSDIHRGTQLHRISLPVYPFAKQRYWVPETEKVSGLSYAPEEYGTSFDEDLYSHIMDRIMDDSLSVEDAANTVKQSLL